MLVPYAHMPTAFEIANTEVKRKPRAHHASIPFREGEFILTKDSPTEGDWYCAEINRVLVDRIDVNYYTTVTEPLEDYATASIAQRAKRLGETSFLRTWCLQVGGYKPTTKPPKQTNRLANDAYRGQTPHPCL